MDCNPAFSRSGGVRGLDEKRGCVHGGSPLLVCSRGLRWHRIRKLLSRSEVDVRGPWRSERMFCAYEDPLKETSLHGNSPMPAEHKEHFRSPQFHHRRWKKPRIALDAQLQFARFGFEKCRFVQFAPAQEDLCRFAHGGPPKVAINTKHKVESVMKVTPVISRERKQRLAVPTIDLLGDTASGCRRTVG